MHIGIIGYGTVGQSIHNMLEKHSVIIADEAKGYSDCVLSTDAAFVCVPTPTTEEGQCIDIVESVLRDLNELLYEGLIIIKSTTTPKNIAKLIHQFGNLSIMHCPEFVSEYAPFVRQTKHLLGVKNIGQAHLYRKIFGLEGYNEHDVRTTDPVTAAIVKYAHNVHGAVKVALFNELFDVCDVEQVNYREMLSALLAVNENVGKQYTQIAADGKRGFGGTCFPKDTAALAKDYGCEVLKGTLLANRKYRDV